MADQPDERFEVQIGRTSNGQTVATFVRVIHLATGIERLQIGYNGSTPKEISSRMALEIISELGNKLTDQST